MTLVTFPSRKTKVTETLTKQGKMQNPPTSPPQLQKLQFKVFRKKQKQNKTKPKNKKTKIKTVCAPH